MIEPEAENYVILHIVDCWKMQFPTKIKVLREAPKQAHLGMKNVAWTRNIKWKQWKLLGQTIRSKL